jgi:hypothetical protein
MAGRWRGRQARRGATARSSWPARDSDRLHPTFRDPELEARFREYGFIVTEFFTDEQVERLRREVQEMMPPVGGFSTSVEIVDEGYRTSVHAWLTSQFAARSSELFVDHDMNLTAVAVKWPGMDGEKPIHQDWTFSDERRFRAVNVWVPLVDTSRANGSLAVLPRSHVVLDRLRPAPSFPAGYHDPLTDLSIDDLDVVELRAGQAIAFDLALVHGSPANLAAEPRCVIAANFLPRSAPARFHYCPDAAWTIDRYAVTDMSFFTRFNFRERPTELHREAEVEFRPSTISSEELLRRCRDPDALAR